MKTVPSLVASSTVGLAAAGLALGRPQHTFNSEPSSNNRKVQGLDHDPRNSASPSPLPRPVTSSAVVTPVRHRAFYDSPTPGTSHLSSGPRHSASRSSTTNPIDRPRGLSLHSENPQNIHEDEVLAVNARGIVSGTGSFRSVRGGRVKRLSMLPVSENTSPRSSIGPDSPSLNISVGSGTPLRPQSRRRATSTPPNKLVKRRTSDRATSNPISKSASRSQGPTSIRPATSHQRSATLQQFTRDLDEQIHQKSPQRISFDPDHLRTPARRLARNVSYRPFFQIQLTKFGRERSLRKSTGDSPDSTVLISRRVLPDNGVPPTLTKPDMMTESEPVPTFIFDDAAPIEYDVDSTPNHENTEDKLNSSKRPHRSSSMHFSSPTSWISRTGSIRMSKRGLTYSGKRNVSAPIEGEARHESPTLTRRRRDITDPAIYRLENESTDNVPGDPFMESGTDSRVRDSSSPLPPLTRLSSFNVDLNRLGLASEGSNATRRSPTSPEPSLRPSSAHITPSSYPGVQRRPISQLLDLLPSDRASTLVGSDNDTRGFLSGDDDDTDFQSETIFDSYRTGATGSIRSQNLPLESMFDESPPSAHSRKSAHIQDLISTGGFLDITGKIIEEEESVSTPIKGKHSRDDLFSTPRRADHSNDDFLSSKLMLADTDFARLSIEDDEEDEDWTRDDDDDFSNSLSPPSLSRSVSQATRAALADLTNTGSSQGNQITLGDEYRQSTLFDWSEQSPMVKSDARPRTVHGKHNDLRGGRVLGRRGPTALHVRSQSVPAVPDAAGQREHTKLTPKFGTWGLAAKGVSEDWDNDFEFESTDIGGDNEDGEPNTDTLSFVPPAIQASQASVKGHVGQIREICLLVEDLKRLRGQGRERGLLHGSSAHLWKEAEGIIALAIPDEEELMFSAPQSPLSADFDMEPSDEKASPEPKKSDNQDGHTGSNDKSRRRSVFSPEDDVFGSFTEPAKSTYLAPPVRPQVVTRDSSEVARSVMETMHQHRSASDPLLPDLSLQSPEKMPFDTTSLRDLVHKASALSRTLAEIIRKADGFSSSPACSPLRERESSPAFTRVFTDPLASPPKPLLRSQSNNSVMSGSIDTSPSRRRLGRMHMMTVV